MLNRGCEAGTTEIIDEGQIYLVAYCDDCHQYYRIKCKCRVPKVLISSTGEVL